MFYHSPQFQNIADQAAAYARPLILQTIRDLMPDFLQKYPDVVRLDCSTGRIEGHREKGIVRNAEWLEMSKNTPLMFFLLDTIHKYTIGFCPDITLQPALMVDGVPIEEAIHNAQPVTFVVQSHNYRNWDGSDADQPNTQTHYVGTDEAKAKAAVGPEEDGVLWTTTKWKDGTQLFFNP